MNLVDNHGNNVVLRCTKEIQDQYTTTTFGIQQLQKDFESAKDALENKIKFLDTIGSLLTSTTEETLKESVNQYMSKFEEEASGNSYKTTRTPSIT